MNDYTATFFFLSFAGQQVIVCAHRYVKNETDQRWGHGQCFTLTQDLRHSATWDPCEGRSKARYGRLSSNLRHKNKTETYYSSFRDVIFMLKAL